jgi:DNA topoisomerase-1
MGAIREMCVEAYCVKCKEKREIQSPEAGFSVSGGPLTRGTCSVCGCRLVRTGRTPAHEGLTPPVPAARKNGGKSGRKKGRLVIVESPAKARTVGRFLGKGYTVRASVGHVRDLLRSQLSVDVENDFEPKYRVPNEKREVVKGLKAEAAKAGEIFLATDLDREGEAIAWHLMQAADIDPALAKRVVFHEITQSAIEHAFENPRRIDTNLVDAQQARRILDRLVGYSLSPLLWEKVRGRLSAGRVQSVALRLVVDRERAIESFVPQEFWTIDAELRKAGAPPPFRARLARRDGDELELPKEGAVRPVADDLRSASFVVARVRKGNRMRRPAAPFTTSTLQQDASRRLGFTARKTMAIAQQLYEGIDLDHEEVVGLITYMRTDSTQVAVEAQAEARRLIAQRFGEAFLPEEPPVYRTRTRGAQEAHEAIRPTSALRLPEDIRASLSPEQQRLYELIWRRFVASQMKPAELDTVSVDIEGRSAQHLYELRVAASAIRFAGYLEAYEDRNGENGEGAESAEEEAPLAQLPDLQQGDALELVQVLPEQHFTQPAPRFTEATLVKALEENGIGRPSTYAPILTTLQQRGYVKRQAKRLNPTDIGITVNDLLVEHFPEVVDLGFTAKMEDELDEVAEGTRRWVEVVREFYVPFAEQVRAASAAMPQLKQEPEKLDRPCPTCGKALVVRFGRYGRFIGCSDFPTCRYTEPWLEKIGVLCPQDGGELVERRTRKGRTFYGCSNYPSCDFTSWKRPLVTACPACGGLLVVENRTSARCTKCGEEHALSLVGQAEADTA